MSNAGDVKSYFEVHAHNYLKSPQFYSSIINEIRDIAPTNGHKKLLDVGCGDGNFVKALINANVNLDYYLTDISLNMIKMAKENVSDSKARFFVADSFKIPVKHDTKFDIIHIDSVLHHLIGATRGKSIALIKKMVELLTNKLNDRGVLIIEEVYYSSHIIPKFTSAVIFYGLKLLNLLNVDLSRFAKELKPGLKVNFLHEKQLLEILDRYGSTRFLHKDIWKMPTLYRLFLLKQLGHITYIVQKI